MKKNTATLGGVADGNFTLLWLLHGKAKHKRAKLILKDFTLCEDMKTTFATGGVVCPDQIHPVILRTFSFVPVLTGKEEGPSLHIYRVPCQTGNVYDHGFFITLFISLDGKKH